MPRFRTSGDVSYVSAILQQLPPGKDACCRGCLSAGAVLALRNRSGRAGTSAGTALDAGIRIDHVLSVSLGDSAYRALSLAGSAAYTRVADYICHSIILLLK